MVSAEAQARVLMFAVAAGYRDRGIGTQLMNAFLGVAANRGMRRIELEVRKSNAGGIQFYRRYGFETGYLLPSFYTDGEDGYKLYKSL